MNIVRNDQFTVLGKATTASTEKVDPLDKPNAPYIGLEHIERDVGTINGQGTAADVKSTKAVFRKGDLLYGKLRPYLNKVWVAQFDGVCSTDILVFPKSGSVDNSFLKYRFMASDFVRFASENSNGVNLPRVNAKALARFPLWLPQIDEQHRIVAEIEQQFTRLDAGVVALRRTQANLKRYRAAVLKAACEGRLVSTEAELAKSQSIKRGSTPQKKDSDSFESGAMLVERILTERRHNCRSRSPRKEPVGLGAADLQQLANGWTWATLDQISQEGRPIIYGIIKPGPDIPDGVPYVRVTEMKDGRIDVLNLKRASHERAAKFARATLAPGDVLISKDGTIGRVAVVPPELAGGNITQHVMRAPIHTMMSRDFVVWAIRSDWCQHWLSGETRGVALRGVNVEDFRRLPIPIPPFAEQTRIVAEVERRLSVVDELESVVKANLQRATRLRQSVLQTAFTGSRSLIQPCIQL